ncbi:hypothetical protein B0H14DRAFT_2415211 [Mycena olivaceomarginata]|nr:hypothetical protein B0H14DRAFT_2415211 [Mycena olivaceomarginata]
MLYLPRRLVSLSDFSYLAYGPTYRYECATKTWLEGSHLSGFHGRTRELFVQNENFIVYAGTYKCYDLSPLHPRESTLLHASYVFFFTLNKLMASFESFCRTKEKSSTRRWAFPRPQDHASLMKQRYPAGKIKVTATGLQCVGFSMELYESLRHRFAISQRRRRGKRGLRAKNYGKRIRSGRRGARIYGMGRFSRKN